MPHASPLIVTIVAGLGIAFLLGFVATKMAYGVEAGLRYSDPGTVEARLREIERRYVERLQAIEGEATLPFNKMSEWGVDGRIKPDAPVYTPFIRHRRGLDIG
jgi:NAD(P)H dehydrogenase (quinone)